MDVLASSFIHASIHTGIEQGSKWMVDGERVWFSLLKWEVKISKGKRIERSMS